MSRKPAALAVAVDASAGGPAAASYISESGNFSQEGFRINQNGIQALPQDIRESTSAAEINAGHIKLDELEFGRVLGKGACSEVREVVHKASGQRYALKQFDLGDEVKRKQLLSELRALGGSRCPALVALQDVFFVRDTMYMMLEFMDAGTLENLIASKPTPSELQAASIIKQVVSGLFFLHGITRQVHRDLKPANILLNNAGAVKISDFGLTRQMGSSVAQAETFVGTLMYLSPERMRGEPYGFPGDIWALGLIAYELVHRKHPYRGYSSRFIDLIQTIIENPVPAPDPELGYPPQFSDFLTKCLAKDPKERPAVGALTDHPWIKGRGTPAIVASWIQE